MRFVNCKSSKTFQMKKQNTQNSGNLYKYSEQLYNSLLSSFSNLLVFYVS